MHQSASQLEKAADLSIQSEATDVSVLAPAVPEEDGEDNKVADIVDSAIMRVVFKHKEIAHVALMKEVKRQVPRSKATLTITDIERGVQRLLASKYMTKDNAR